MMEDHMALEQVYWKVGDRIIFKHTKGSTGWTVTAFSHLRGDFADGNAPDINHQIVNLGHAAYWYRSKDFVRFTHRFAQPAPVEDKIKDLEKRITKLERDDHFYFIPGV